MANDIRVQGKPVRGGASRTRKIVLSILSLAVFVMVFLLFGNPLIVLVTGGNLGELIRGEKYDKALSPVAVGDLKTVLDKDIAGALKSGELAPSTGAGVSIAVVQRGVTRIFSYGTAKPDSIYEIGSITKTFTGLVLSQMVEQGTVRFDDPVRELLPSGLVPKPAGGEITLLSLATQHSGLPRLPDNLHPTNPADPYADYRPADLYAFLAKHTVAMPAQTEYLYSNLGFGLLGYALSNRAGVPYSALLEQEVTGPLGMRDTVIYIVVLRATGPAASRAQQQSSTSPRLGFRCSGRVRSYPLFCTRHADVPASQSASGSFESDYWLFSCRYSPICSYPISPAPR